MLTTYFGLADTPIGSLLVAGEGRTLVAVKFDVDDANAAASIDEFHRETRGAFTFVRDDGRVTALGEQLREYLDGKRHALDLDLDLSWVTPFRRRVLSECAAIPRGQVITYAELARRAGSPNGARAAGNVMRTNPIPIVIPCHRVIGSNGSLTGFGGGLDVKAQLLQLEGARIT